MPRRRKLLIEFEGEQIDIYCAPGPFIAHVLGVTVQTVWNLWKQGVFEQLERGRYCTPHCINRYVLWKRGMPIEELPPPRVIDVAAREDWDILAVSR